MTSPAYGLVLTGASGGLGNAFATALAPLCSAIVLCGQDGARLTALEQKLQALHPALALRTVAGNLLDPAVQARIAAEATALPTPVDLLVNAAGVNDFSAFESQSAATLEYMLGVNLMAPMQITQRLLPLLKSARRAQIVNIGSIFGYLGYPGFAVYCATKFGLRGFSQALRRELSDTNVAVRYFAPRAVSTALTTPAIAAMNRELRNTQDDPDAVAAALVRFVAATRWDRKLGFPERLYVWLNHLVPAVNDKAIRGQLAVIRKHLGPKAAPNHTTERSRP